MFFQGRATYPLVVTLQGRGEILPSPPWSRQGLNLSECFSRDGPLTPLVVTYMRTPLGTGQMPYRNIVSGNMKTWPPVKQRLYFLPKISFISKNEGGGGRIYLKFSKYKIYIQIAITLETKVVDPIAIFFLD